MSLPLLLLFMLTSFTPHQPTPNPCQNRYTKISRVVVFSLFPFYTKKMFGICMRDCSRFVIVWYACMCVSIFISTYSASAFPTWSLNWMQPTTIVLIFLEKQKRKLHVLIHFPFAFNLPTSPRRRQTKIAAARRLKHRACNGVNMFCLANTQAHSHTAQRHNA